MTTLIAAARFEERGGVPLRSLIKLVALVCLASALNATTPALGQTPPAADDPYLQTVWTTEEGLPQNSVNAILQTRDGYLWLATFGGLARFDGVKFTIFNSGNTPGLKSNRILTLCEARDGTLWLGTQTGEVMTFKDGVGQTYAAGDGLPGGHVWAVKEDRGGTLWAGTQKGLARFQDGRFTVYTTRDGLPDDQTWAIHEDEAGRLWLTTDGGLVRFDGGKFTTYKPPAGLAAESWAPASVRREGGLWVGTRGGVARFGDGNYTPYPHPDGEPDWMIRTLMEARDGTLWISYYSPKVVYRFENGKFSVYQLKSGQELIRSMYEDREGNLWLGSDGGGLIRLKPRRLTTYTVEEGLPSDIVRAITDDGAGGVWIATNAGLAHRQAGRFKTYTDKDGMLSYELFALCRDRAGALWIGSNYGLTRFKDKRFTNYTAAEGLSDPEVYSIAEDREGTLWVGTASGLNQLRDGRFTVYTRADGLVDDSVRFITQARDGALWLGTAGGLSRFRDGAFTNYTTKDGLSNDYVRAVHEDPDGTLWLGTYGGGLNRFKDGRFTAVTTKHGLFDDFISRIMEDERGRFWLLGNRGVFWVDRRELNDFVEGRAHAITSTSYGVADGMKSSEGNGGLQPAGWRTADGDMWFPTIKGVVRIDPDETNQLPPPVRIEGVTIDRAALPAGQSVEVKPGQENLEIQYAGLSFSRPEQVKFKYRLVNLDADWVEAGTRRTAYYSHLPPGEYVFKVIADNGEGVWNTEGESLRVAVLPPFYRQWWFVALCVFGVGGFIFFVVRARINKLKKARREQEEFSRRLLASQEHERQRIAAELHDTLGQSLLIMKNRVALAQDDIDEKETVREQLDELAHSAAAAIDECREIAYNLRPYQISRFGLSATLRGIFMRLNEVTQIRVTAEVDDVDALLPDEAQISVYRIVQECVNNIIKHSGATEALLAVKQNGGEITLLIEDNGRGMAPVGETGAGKNGGFGLIGIAERVKMLRGSYEVSSVTGRGTSIRIRLSGRQNNGN